MGSLKNGKSEVCQVIEDEPKWQTVSSNGGRKKYYIPDPHIFYQKKSLETN